MDITSLANVEKLAKLLRRKPCQVSEDLDVCRRIVNDTKWTLDNFFVKGKGWLYEPLVSYQREFIDRLLSDSDKQCEVLPRGHCKTTLTRAWLILAAATGKYKYIVHFGATKENAQGNKESFDAAYNSQSFRDLQWYLAYWNGLEIAEVTGSEARLGNGALVEFKSFGGEARGLNRRGRPDLIILDDVLPTEVADSYAIREEITSRYFSMIRPMGEEGCKIVVVGTVMHKDDLIWKLATGKIGGYQSTILPAYNEETKEVLWPERWTLEELERIREQEYINAGRGHLFRREFLSDPAEGESHPFGNLEYKYYEDIDPKRLFRVVVVDSAGGTGRDEFVVAEVGMDSDEKIYIIDIRHSNEWDIKRRLAEVAAVLSRRRPNILVCERTVESVTFIEMMESYLRDNHCYIPIEQPTSNKTGAKNNRIYGFLQPQMEEGRVFIDAKKEWAEALQKQTASFDITTKNNSDDMIDAVSYGIKYLKPFRGEIVDRSTGDPLIDKLRRDMARKERRPRFNRARPRWI